MGSTPSAALGPLIERGTAGSSVAARPVCATTSHHAPACQRHKNAALRASQQGLKRNARLQHDVAKQVRLETNSSMRSARHGAGRTIARRRVPLDQACQFVEGGTSRRNMRCRHTADAWDVGSLLGRRHDVREAMLGSHARGRLPISGCAVTKHFAITHSATIASHLRRRPTNPRSTCVPRTENSPRQAHARAQPCLCLGPLSFSHEAPAWP